MSLTRSSLTRRSVTGQRISEMNVVPYVDVLLVVLTVFVVATPLIAHGVLVRLPKGGVEVLPNNALPLTVTIEDTGGVYVGESHGERRVDDFTLSREASAVLRRRPGTPVILRASERTEYGKVIRIMALLKSAGAPSIGLMTANGRR
jgi:biopolymer transport protein TolR